MTWVTFRVQFCANIRRRCNVWSKIFRPLKCLFWVCGIHITLKWEIRHCYNSMITSICELKTGGRDKNETSVFLLTMCHMWNGKFPLSNEVHDAACLGSSLVAHSSPIVQCIYHRKRYMLYVYICFNWGDMHFFRFRGSKLFSYPENIANECPHSLCDINSTAGQGASINILMINHDTNEIDKTAMDKVSSQCITTFIFVIYWNYDTLRRSNMETLSQLLVLCEGKPPVDCPHKKGQNRGLRCFIWSFDPRKRSNKTIEKVVIWDAIALFVTSL